VHDVIISVDGKCFNLNIHASQGSLTTHLKCGGQYR